VHAIGLVIVGLLLEIMSLLWFHPLSFVLFAFVAVSLIGLSVLGFSDLCRPATPSEPRLIQEAESEGLIAHAYLVTTVNEGEQAGKACLLFQMILRVARN
jgi:hypothetical protein